MLSAAFSIRPILDLSFHSRSCQGTMIQLGQNYVETDSHVSCNGNIIIFMVCYCLENGIAKKISSNVIFDRHYHFQNIVII
jgi:hypothetical protein